MTSRTSRLALCQMAVSSVKADNLAKAAAVIATARNTHKADVVILPECFNCPYGTKFFPDYAEPIPPVGSSLQQITTEFAATCKSAAVLAQAAFDNKVWLVGGSIPEESVGEDKSEKRKLFNTSMIFSPEGSLLAKHRKIHLFRINTETVKMDEGEVLTAGDSTTTFDVKNANGNDFKVGVGICFDIRYPQLAMAYHQQNTSLLVYPGAFNMALCTGSSPLSAAPSTRSSSSPCAPLRAIRRRATSRTAIPRWLILGAKCLSRRATERRLLLRILISINSRPFAADCPSRRE